MQKRTAFKLCLAGATAVALNAAPVAVFAKDEPLKVAFVYVSPANEEGWSSRCLLYTSPSPRDGLLSRMPSSA